MNTQKYLRHCTDYIANQGMTVTEVVEGKHLKIRVATPTGVKLAVIARTTCSQAGQRNFEAMIRRWARGGK